MRNVAQDQGLLHRRWWSVIGLCLCAAVLGFATGRNMTDLSEAEVIGVYAKVYAQETGGLISDCLGVPGRGDVWLIVRCGGGDRAMVFHVAADGGLIHVLPDRAA